MDWLDCYYDYLRRCKIENWIHMRDPAHDFMEWNHTLPKSLFGDHPVGMWLTHRQHAIASALQTLAFRQNCLHGKHLKHLSPELRDLVKQIRNKTMFTSEKQSQRGKLSRGVPKNLVNYDPAVRAANAAIARSKKTAQSNVNGGKAAGPINGKVAMSQKWQCTVTGKVTNAAALSRYQMARGIETTNRIRIA